MVESRHGPLAGVRVVEFDANETVPFASMLLADLGCDVVRIRRLGPDGSAVVPLLYRGRSEIMLDLNDPNARASAFELATRADGVIEGFPPGTLETVGLGPERCLAANPRLVYGRRSGWGVTGPLAGQPGNDINFLALSGALHAIGTAATPIPPLGLVAEFAGGATLMALGMVSGILSAQATGRGQIVDASQLQGAALLMTLYYALHGTGRWSDLRGSNLTDGSAPFYRCYACRDGRHVAVGALEPGEFEALCQGLGLKRNRFQQYDRKGWDDMTAAFAGAFATRPRDEWARQFEGRGACVTPVLSLAEAPLHPQNRARHIFGNPLGPLQPMPGPLFSLTPAEAVPQQSTSVGEVLTRWS